MSPDGRYLAEVESTESPQWPRAGLGVYATADWTALPPAEDLGEHDQGLAFSPEGRFLATGHMVHVGEQRRSVGAFGHYMAHEYDYLVRVREVPSGRVVKTIPGWQQGVRFLAFSPDGSTLVGTAGPRLRVWDLANDREIALHKRGDEALSGTGIRRQPPPDGQQRRRSASGTPTRGSS